MATSTPSVVPTPSPASSSGGGGGGGGGGPTSSPLLFFVALGFGVVFTNLWYVRVSSLIGPQPYSFCFQSLIIP